MKNLFKSLEIAIANIIKRTPDASDILGVLFFFAFVTPGLWYIGCWNPAGIVMVITGLAMSGTYLNTK